MKKSKIYEAPACKVHEIQVEGALCTSLILWNSSAATIETADKDYYGNYSW